MLDPPSTPDMVLEAVDRLLASPTARVLSPGPRWPELEIVSPETRQGG